MSSKLIQNWLIPQKTFYPHSIHCIGDNAKTVLIVPGEQNIYTMVLKNLSELIKTDGMPYKISCITLEDTNGGLVETVVTASNTVSVKQCGELVVFSSFRECVTVRGITGIKAIASMDNGKKLLLMRLIYEDKLQLEIFDDLSGHQLTQSVKTFDLSWEKSGFENSRQHQSHKVGTVKASKENLKFFQRFFNCRDISEGAELIMFTVDSGLFWLKITEDSYEVVAVKVFPAVITDFNHAPSTCCFSILLQNAVLHIYSISDDPESLLIQELKVYLGHTIECHQFVTNSSTLLYSEGFQIIQLRYFYSNLSKCIQKVSIAFPVTGVVGITYLAFAKIAICVTENRLFYSIPIALLNDEIDTRQNEYFELTDEILTQAKQMTCMLTNEVHAGSKIAKSMEQEQSKIDILTSFINQSVCTRFIESKLVFCNKIPNITYKTKLLSKMSMDDVIFAEIFINLKNGYDKTLRQQQNWILSITIDATVTHIPLDTINLVECSIAQLIYPIKGLYLKTKGLPKIMIKIFSVVSHSHDFIHLAVPISIKCSEDTAHLFEVNLGNVNTLPTVAEYELPITVRSVIRRCEQRTTDKLPLVKYYLKVTNNVKSIANFISVIGVGGKPPTEIEDTTEKAFISIGNNTIEVQKNIHRNELGFMSDAPGIMLLLKILYNRKIEQTRGVNMNKLKAIQLQLMQCENQRESIIDLYHQMRNSST